MNKPHFLSNPPKQFLIVNEKGHIISPDGPVSNQEMGFFLLENMSMSEDSGHLYAKGPNDEIYLVEAYDAPYIAENLEVVELGNETKIKLNLPYQFHIYLNLESVCVDEWDNFYALAENGVPVSFSKNAQSDFFDLVDEFGDDYFIFNSKKYETPFWLIDREDIKNSKFWSDKYTQNTTPWDLGEPSPALIQVLPQLKLHRQRILVLGSGSGQDAAYLAQQGHLVTAVDFSSEAIELSKKQFSNIKNLQFIKADIFNLPHDFENSYDLIFEHTCFCAISPQKRNELIQIWRKCLVEGGHLLGVFFTRVFSAGPPYGGTEKEYQKRLKPYFKTLYWTRWRESVYSRQGIELVIYAQSKKE